MVDVSFPLRSGGLERFAHRKSLKFDADDARAAWKLYGANCGPGALAAMAGIALERAVMAIPGFLEKGYTKETMLRPALEELGIQWTESVGEWPRYGMVRVIFEGPWSEEGLFARFAHSHWIGHVQEGDESFVFDINAMGVGGWLTREEWIESCLPWILEAYEPLADGRWTLWETFEFLAKKEEGFEG